MRAQASASAVIAGSPWAHAAARVVAQVQYERTRTARGELQRLASSRAASAWNSSARRSTMSCRASRRDVELDSPGRASSAAPAAGRSCEQAGRGTRSRRCCGRCARSRARTRRSRRRAGTRSRISSSWPRTLKRAGLARNEEQDVAQVPHAEAAHRLLERHDARAAAVKRRVRHTKDVRRDRWIAEDERGELARVGLVLRRR